MATETPVRAGNKLSANTVSALHYMHYGAVTSEYLRHTCFRSRHAKTVHVLASSCSTAVIHSHVSSALLERTVLCRLLHQRNTFPEAGTHWR